MARHEKIIIHDQKKKKKVKKVLNVLHDDVSCQTTLRPHNIHVNFLKL